MQRKGIKDNDYNQKFKLRDSMDFTEYVRAYMNMLTCSNPPFPIIGNIKHHLQHIEQLAEDNKIKRWDVVKKWSNYMFDNVEKGNITWENELKVQLERQRIQDAAERATSQNTMICKMYNAMQNGCKADEEDKNCKEHTVGNTVMQHICSYCNRALGQSYNHPEWKCRNKRGNKRFNNNNERQQQQQPYYEKTYYNNNQGRQQANYPHQNTHQYQPQANFQFNGIEPHNNHIPQQWNQNQQQHQQQWQFQPQPQFKRTQTQQNTQNQAKN